MEEKGVKVGAAGIMTIVAYMSGNFTSVMYILILFEVIDYITGVLSAKKNGGLSSGEALWGFIKKISYFFIVTVAFGFDFIISEVGMTAGINLQWPAVFGILSVGYLVSTEAISILENLSEIGISVPFLTAVLKTFRDKIQKGGENYDKH